MSHQTFGAPATKPSFVSAPINLVGSNGAYGLVRGLNSADAVNASFRAGGSISFADNYVNITLVYPAAAGRAGNEWDLRIHRGASAHSITANDETKRIDIYTAHANTSVNELNTVIGANGAGIVTSTEHGTTSDAIAGAGLLGQFSGGKDEVFAKHRKVLLCSAINNAEAELVYSSSATAPGAGVHPDFMVSRHSWPIMVDLPGDKYLYARRWSAGTSTQAAINRAFVVREYTDLIALQPEMVSHSV